MTMETITQTATTLVDPKQTFIDLTSTALERLGFAIEILDPLNQDAVAIRATNHKQLGDITVTSSGREIRINSTKGAMIDLVAHRIKAATS